MRHTHHRRPDAELYRKLYQEKRWRGRNGVREQALLRDLYTCQRCGVIVTTGNRNDPRLANVNHKIPHRGNEDLFFSIDNVETTCQACHSGLIQKEEARGYVIGSDIKGRPIDPNHPWNQR